MLTDCAAHQVGAGHQAGLDGRAHSPSEQGANHWLYATGDGDPCDGVVLADHKEDVDPCDGVVLADHKEDVDLHPDGTHGWQGRHCSHWTQQCCTQGTFLYWGSIAIKDNIRIKPPFKYTRQTNYCNYIWSYYIFSEGYQARRMDRVQEISSFSPWTQGIYHYHFHQSKNVWKGWKNAFRNTMAM